MKRQLAVKWEGDAAAKCPQRLSNENSAPFVGGLPQPQASLATLGIGGKAGCRGLSIFWPSFLPSLSLSLSLLPFISLEIHGRWSFCPTVPDDELSRSSARSTAQIAALTSFSVVLEAAAKAEHTRRLLRRIREGRREGRRGVEGAQRRDSRQTAKIKLEALARSPASIAVSRVGGLPSSPRPSSID